MEFKASLKLPCENPKMIAAAISNGDGDTGRPSEAYTDEDGCLIVDITAGKVRDLAKSLNAVLSRFMLSVETIGLCRKLEGEDQPEQEGRPSDTEYLE